MLINDLDLRAQEETKFLRSFEFSLIAPCISVNRNQLITLTTLFVSCGAQDQVRLICIPHVHILYWAERLPRMIIASCGPHTCSEGSLGQAAKTAPASDNNPLGLVTDAEFTMLRGDHSGPMRWPHQHGWLLAAAAGAAPRGGLPGSSAGGLRGVSCPPPGAPQSPKALAGAHGVLCCQFHPGQPNFNHISVSF